MFILLTGWSICENMTYLEKVGDPYSIPTHIPQTSSWMILKHMSFRGYSRYFLFLW